MNTSKQSVGSSLNVGLNPKHRGNHCIRKTSLYVQNEINDDFDIKHSTYQKIESDWMSHLNHNLISPYPNHAQESSSDHEGNLPHLSINDLDELNKDLPQINDQYLNEMPDWCKELDNSMKVDETTKFLNIDNGSNYYKNA